MTLSRAVVGRFAPSPTGVLHLGSLTTAVASFCHIKSLGGKWLLRLEDTDFERCKPEYSTQILRDLESLGLYWDDGETYQSKRIHLYDECLANLSQFSYACNCSRKQLDTWAKNHPQDTHTNADIYPRFCLNQKKDQSNNKIRLILPNIHYVYYDELQGVIIDNPQTTLGDVVIKRQNNIYNYIFCTAIDDGLQGISHIMRGLDIAMMTGAQIAMRAYLGLPAVSYFAHLPLIYNQNGQKLSKQNLAKPIDTRQPEQLLRQALTLLGQPLPSETMDKHEILSFATAHWDSTPLKSKQQLDVILA